MVKPDELLLLHAILEKNDNAALASYAQWTQNVGLDKIEGGSFQLLPLLYKRLSRLRQPVPHLNKLKGIYRQSLYRNSLLFHKAFIVIAGLEKMQVPVILLKGTALIAAYYEDIGARMMNDVDFLVQAGDVEKTLHYLKELGWQNKDGVSLRKAVNRVHHALHLQNPDGYELDVHWRVFHQCSWDGGMDQAHWQQTETVTFKGLNIRLLNPTHQILHNCVHGVSWNSLSSIRWIVDVMMILEKRADEVDWELLVSEAANRKLTATMLHALSFLNSKFNANIPEEILSRLIVLPKDPQELRLFEKLTSPVHFINMGLHWLMHSYSLGPAPFWKKAVLFPDYLKEMWNLQSIFQLPFFGIKRLIEKLAQAS